MTRDQLELICRREGLTRPQTSAVLAAADDYATAQCRAAVDWFTPTVHYLAGAKLACGKKNEDAVNTTDRGRVTCGRCKDTRAWRAAA